MAFCPHCGNELPNEENLNSCPSCGAPIQASNEGNVTNDNETNESTPIVNIDTEALKQKASEMKDKAAAGAKDLKDKAAPVMNDMKDKAAPVMDNVKEKYNKLDSKYKPLAILIPILAVLLVVFLLTSGSGGYMKPLDNCMSLINKQSEDGQKLMFSLVPEYQKKAIEKVLKAGVIDADDLFDEVNDSLEDAYDEMNDEFKKVKLSFEVKDKEKMSKKDLDDIKDVMEEVAEDAGDEIDDIEESLDDDDAIESAAEFFDVDEKDIKNFWKATKDYYKALENAKVTAAYEVKGKFVIKADKDEYKSDTVKLTFVKVNGKWCYAGADDYITFDDDEDGYFNFIKRMLNNSFLTGDFMDNMM